MQFASLIAEGVKNGSDIRSNITSKKSDLDLISYDRTSSSLSNNTSHHDGHHLRQRLTSTDSRGGGWIGEGEGGRSEGRLERRTARAKRQQRRGAKQQQNNIPPLLLFSSSLRSSHISPTHITNNLLIVASLLITHRSLQI